MYKLPLLWESSVYQCLWPSYLSRGRALCMPTLPPSPGELRVCLRYLSRGRAPYMPMLPPSPEISVYAFVTSLAGELRGRHRLAVVVIAARHKRVAMRARTEDLRHQSDARRLVVRHRRKQRRLVAIRFSERRTHEEVSLVARYHVRTVNDVWKRDEMHCNLWPWNVLHHTLSTHISILY